MLNLNRRKSVSLNRRFQLFCGGAGLSVAIGLAGSIAPVHVAAACAAVGAYTVVQNGALYAASALPSGAFPLVYGGTATIQRYTGCGAPTRMQITTTGPGSLLSKPVYPGLGYRLRAAGDLLLHFSGTATQDALAPHDPRAVRLSGTATYAHVTTQGSWHGKQRLAYGTRTVQVKNVPAQLRVTADFGGAFSLSCGLPGPSVGGVPSRFAYFAVGARTPARLIAARTPDAHL
jgi:hypothetical protein